MIARHRRDRASECARKEEKNGTANLSFKFLALRRLRAGLRQRGNMLFFYFPGTYSSARVARLGVVPGYFQPRLTALNCREGTTDRLFPVSARRRLIYIPTLWA